MMAKYEFSETSSRNITEDGVQVRLVNYRGKDDASIPNIVLNVDGSFTMPVMDYFIAGAENRLSDVIRDHVLAKIAGTESEDTENAE
ncbi:hypothetical protein [Ornithinibacillus sp. JPR2-1]|uniref:hypothetical protein n=1 Tax=Ornithinibacillus sp. JPR2-1 TaxID=2094019 RepID=UPI0031D26FE8